jgi:hypothetical protein
MYIGAHFFAPKKAVSCRRFGKEKAAPLGVSHLSSLTLRVSLFFGVDLGEFQFAASSRPQTSSKTCHSTVFTSLRPLLSSPKLP